MPTDPNYYPAIKDLITIDDLPEILSFIKDGSQQVFDDIYYEDYQISNSVDGSSAFHSLNIVSKQKIEIEIPGTGIYLVLNPDYSDDTVSSFPITLFWQWDILKFVNYFSVNGFSFSIKDLFNLALAIFNLTEEQALKIAANTFVIPSNPSITILGQLVSDINALYSSNIVIDEDADDPYQDLIVQVGLLNQEVFPTIFSLYLSASDPSVASAKLNSFFSAVIPSDLKDYIMELVIPKARATLELSAALEFPREVLLPMTQAADGSYTADTTLDASGHLKKTYIQFADAILDVDTDTGFGYQTEFSGTLYPQYAQIGNTCLIISFTDVKLDLSTKTNIPEADAAGYPVDFVGAYIGHASVILNGFGSEDLNHSSVSLVVNNFLIGTGGISGTIGLDTTGGALYRQFGNFAVELDAFAITFRQNAILSSAISGKLVIGKFTQDGQPAIIDIEASIRDNGDFTITAKPQTGPITITLPNVLELKIRSLSIGSKGGRYYIAVAGQLDFIADVPVLGNILPKGIEIDKLLIWDNGDLEFDGGGIVLPKAFRLSVGPVKLEVTHMALGAYGRKVNNIDRHYCYFGFDGMINTGRAGVKATGNGIKYYFTTDDNGADKLFDNFVSIDGIAIDITIPGDASPDKAAFILKGFLGMHNPDPAVAGSKAGEEYTGSVSFTMPKLKLSGSAGMRITPSIPSFVVDIGLDLSTPVPLGGTGLGIYGFRGLIGQHYIPSRSAIPALPDTATWWDYYKAPSAITHREGIEIDKFADDPGFSIGAGATIATSFDSGFTFSAKLFLLLGLPDVFLIEGQAGILRSRIGLQDDVDPPFSALIAIGDNSFHGNLGVDFNLPDNGSLRGDILSLQGSMDMAFFFNNASGWYLNIGKDSPDTAQVHAKILSLFEGHAYLMISAQGIKAGAGIRFDFNRSYGPVSVGVGASLNMGGFISFAPFQIGGFIELGGYAYARLWRFGLSVSVYARLAVEAPHPFNIVGSFGLHIHTPWPLPNINIDVELSWRINNDMGPLLAPIPVLQLPDDTTGYAPAVATNILSSETFGLNYVNNYNSVASPSDIPEPGNNAWKYDFTSGTDVLNVTIPLDSFIDIELLKPVIPGQINVGGASNQLPDGYKELLPPQRGVGDQVTHQYEITDLEIYAWKDNASGKGWVPYQIYLAVTAIVSANTGPGAIDLSSLKPGYWQFTDKNKYNKIRLLSQNMFSYTADTTSSHLDLDARNFAKKDIFCYETIYKSSQINWKGIAANTNYAAETTVLNNGESLTFHQITGTVLPDTADAFNSLEILARQGSLVIDFSQPVSGVTLDFGTNKNNILIQFIEFSYLPTRFGAHFISKSVLGTATLAADQQNQSLRFSQTGNTINEVVLNFNPIIWPDYTGDLVIGGHFRLPDTYATPSAFPMDRDTEQERSLMNIRLYSRAFTAQDVVSDDYDSLPGLVAGWPMTGAASGVLNGNPAFTTGFYAPAVGSALLSNPVYDLMGNDDALVVPYAPEFKVENDSFAIELTVIFDPFTPGISTLLYKVLPETDTTHQTGFALHLVQNNPGTHGTAYTSSTLPSYMLWLTFYNSGQTGGLQVSDQYTMVCDTGTLNRQYKNIFISVDRTAGQIDIYVDKLLKLSTAIPDVFKAYDSDPMPTFIKQLGYLTAGIQARMDDNPITPTQVIEEVQVLSDNLSKTIQPVWRPDTTYAVLVKTRDRVNGALPDGTERSSVFGFRTAGPVGHFHQQSKKYQQLASQDKAAEFKLANLKGYIDYERSYPDAQGRYDLSKPVFWQNPQVKLFFTQPYINAMFSNWDSYNNTLSPVSSSLEVQLIDPFGNISTESLQWEPVREIAITAANVDTLPEDQKVMYLLSQAAGQGTCNPMPVPVTKKLRQGTYQFPDLSPNKLYTALFNAIYQPAGAEEQRSEVHKFSFKTSQYATFEAQAGSYILDAAADPALYAIYPRGVAFSAADIDTKLKPLINNDDSDDPVTYLQYAQPYDRLVYGGLGFTGLEPVNNSTITLVINTDPGDHTTKRMLGILIRNPEPFNDPKLIKAVLADTIRMSMVTSGGIALGSDQFIVIYSGDTSSAFVTNTAMDLPKDAAFKLAFSYKVFNGTDYDTLKQDFEGPSINLGPYTS
jgi:hypothetical protein